MMPAPDITMKKLYVRDEDWANYLGRHLRIIRGTEDITDKMKGRDQDLSPMESGEPAQAWVLVTEAGTERRYVPNDDWELYEG
jgi:hypothetical protein